MSNIPDDLFSTSTTRRVSPWEAIIGTNKACVMVIPCRMSFTYIHILYIILYI